MSTWTTGAIIAANMFIAAAVAAGGFAVWQAIRQPPRAPVPYDVPSLNDPDPQVGWTLKASFSSTDCRNPLVKYHTNDRGFRAAEPGEVAPRMVDVIVVGGSQSFGGGVPYGGTFAAVLEGELGLRVANLSVGSYGGVASVLLTDRFTYLRPSLLIYGFWEDHLFRNLAKCQNSYAPYCVSQPHLSCADGETCRLVPPGDNTQSMRLMMDYVRDQGQGRATYGFLSDLYWTVRLTAQTLLRQAGLADQYVRVSDPATLRDAASAFFELIANRANLLGASPVVVFIPLYFNNIVNDAPDYVVQAAKANKVGFVNLADRFRLEIAVRPGSIAIPGDGHMSERAHRLVAEAIIDHLHSQGLVAAPERQLQRK